jgi:hypothetical protein
MDAVRRGRNFQVLALFFSPKMRRLSITLTVLCLALLCAVGSASAKVTCTMQGAEVVKKGDGFVILRRATPYKGWSFGGPFAYYGCSTKYKKRAFLGNRGTGPKGEIWTQRFVGNSRYLAYVHGSNDLKGNFGDTDVTLRSLETRRRLGVFPIGTPTLFTRANHSITDSLVVSRQGAVAWVAETLIPTPSSPRQYEVHLVDDRGDNLIAPLSDSIDPLDLSFSKDGKRLIWADASGRKTVDVAN